MKYHSQDSNNINNPLLDTNAYLANHYLRAVNELACIYKNHCHIILSESHLDLTLSKLKNLLEDAASGDWEGIKEVEKNGGLTLLGALDILEDKCISSEYSQEVTAYQELEEDLLYLFRHYFES